MGTPPRSGSRLGHLGHMFRGGTGEQVSNPEASQNERLVTAIFERAERTNVDPADVAPANDRDIVSAGQRRPAGPPNDEPEVPTHRLDSVMVLGSYIRYAVEWLVRPGLRRRNKAALEELWRLRRTKKIYAFLNSKGASG